MKASACPLCTEICTLRESPLSQPALSVSFIFLTEPLSPVSDPCPPHHGVCRSPGVLSCMGTCGGQSPLGHSSSHFEVGPLTELVIPSPRPPEPLSRPL